MSFANENQPIVKNKFVMDFEGGGGEGGRSINKINFLVTRKLLSPLLLIAQILPISSDCLQRPEGYCEERICDGF